MTEYFIKCLFIILIISFTLITLISATSYSPSNQADDPEDYEHKQFYQPVDRSEWVDSGDMFTYDPSTKTNREPRLKEAASIMIQRARERKKAEDEQTNWCYSDCEEINVKLRNCEEAQKQSKCECSINDHCGRRSYQIIRRLMILLNKQLRNEYSRGSILELKFNLDDVFFQMPENIKNTSDCEYLSYLHPLVDQLLPSIVVYHPEPFIAAEYLSLKIGSTCLGGLLLAICLFRMPWKIRLLAFFIIFFFIVLIWEYLLLYQTEMAKVEEKSNRLKDKCESQAKTNWFGWISSLVPVLNFGSENSECVDYYISTRVNPLLAINPILVFSKLYEHTVLYALTLTANATGAAFKAFFSHIPAFWVPLFLLAGVILLIYTCKYSFKYRTRTKKSKPSKQKTSIREETKRQAFLGPSKTKCLPKSETKTKKLNVELPVIRYGSTGNIQKLFNQ